LTFSLLFPFYDQNTINLYVLAVLSIGGIINATLLPVSFASLIRPKKCILLLQTSNRDVPADNSFLNYRD